MWLLLICVIHLYYQGNMWYYLSAQEKILIIIKLLNGLQVHWYEYAYVYWNHWEVFLGYS